MRLIVDGQPQRKQRPRFARRGSYVTTYTPKQTSDYEAWIRKCYEDQIGHYMAFDGDEPLSVHIIAYYEIHKSFSKKKRQLAVDNLLKPTNRIDVDNTAKVVLDSLNNVCYKDDHYVTDLVVRKRYSEQPRLEIEIREVKE